MKRILLMIAGCITLFAANNVQAQAPGISWKKIYYKIPATEYGAVAEPTDDGGYIAGASSANLFWVFKTDAGGTQQWERYISSGTGLVNVYAIKQTSDKGYIVAGSDYKTATPSPNGNHGIRDFLLVKLDKDGNVTWMKCLGGTLNEEAYSVEQTTDGGYIVAGMASSNDGDVSGWHGNSDAWVVKVDASGNITWQKTLGGTLSDYARSIVQTSDGGYVMAGYSGSKDGDVTGTHWGGSDDDVWVVKLDASGNVSWQKSYGGSKEDQAYSIRQTTDGGYIVAGSTVSGDGNVTGKHGTSHDNQDFWVLKLDGSGNLTWQKTLGGSGSGIGAGSGNDFAYSVRQTTDGGYVVAGTVSSGTTDNDDIKGYHGATGSDYWIVKLDGSGNISWQKCLGGNGTEDVKSVAQTSDGGYIIGGMSLLSPDGDVASPDYSSSHPWLVKLGAPMAVHGPGSSKMLIDVYPNPANTAVTFGNLPVGSSLRITDVMGKVIHTCVTAKTSETINTGNFINGIYIAQIESNGSVAQVKFVVHN